MNYTKLIGFILFIFWNAELLSTPILNELCPKNENIIVDEDGEYVDWIEIYNTNTIAPIALQDYFLSDNPNVPQKWAFPNITLNAGGYLLIFASDKDRTGANLHTNFKLSSEGETLILSHKDDGVIDQITFPALGEDQSFGRKEDGQMPWTTFFTPSPNQSNTIGTTVEDCCAKQPIVNREGGFFNAPFQFIATPATTSDRLYYTLDGSEPDETDLRYEVPLNLAHNTIIRVRAYADNKEPSPIISNSYFFEEPPTQLPVLSILTDPHWLWDETQGIYVEGPNASPEHPHYGANYWQDWEIPIALEFFDTDEQAGFKGIFYLKIHGGTAARTKPMRPFRILAKQKHGLPFIDYPIFPDKATTQFKRFVLRNSGSDFNEAHFRDGIIHQWLLKEALNIDVNAFRPALVYLNGEYWGIYHIREKIDKYYLNGNYGVDIEQVDLLEEDTIVIEGSAVAFEELEQLLYENDIHEPKNYQAIGELLDIPSFCDYFIAETFFNNWDWPKNNLKLWREQKEGAKWRYLLFDLDISLNAVFWAEHHTDLLGELIHSPEERASRNNKVFRRLLQNQMFRHYFINRYADLLNTSFQSEGLKREVEELVQLLEPEMARHKQKWGGTMDNWYQIIEEEVIPFIEERPAYSRQFLVDDFNLAGQYPIHLQTNPPNMGKIQINTITPEELPWTGIYFKGIPVDLSIVGEDGMVFRNWTVQSSGEQLFSSNVSLNLQATDTITAHFGGAWENTTLSLIPNPTTNQTVLLTNLINTDQHTLRIFNVAGKLIQERTINGQMGLNRIDIPTEQWTRGVYLLQLQNNKTAQHQSATLVVY